MHTVACSMHIALCCSPVLLDIEQEAAAELWPGCASIEQRWCSVCEHFLTHECVGLERRVNVLHVDAQCYSHDHVTWALYHLAIDAQQVGPL
jgi:hypothetical protein